VSWRADTQRAVRPDPVVVLPPPSDKDLGFAERVEDLEGHQLLLELPSHSEGLAASRLPMTPRCRTTENTTAHRGFIPPVGRGLPSQPHGLPMRDVPLPRSPAYPPGWVTGNRRRWATLPRTRCLCQQGRRVNGYLWPVPRPHPLRALAPHPQSRRVGERGVRTEGERTQSQGTRCQSRSKAMKKQRLTGTEGFSPGSGLV